MRILVIILVICAVTAGGFFLYHKFYNETYKIKLVYNYVDNLKTNDPVMMNKARIGEVQDVSLFNNKVRVIADIYGRFKIPQNSKFYISSFSQGGQRFIDVIPVSNTGPFILPESTVIGEDPAKSGDVLTEGEAISKGIGRLAVVRPELVFPEEEEEKEAEAQALMSGEFNLGEKTIGEISKMLGSLVSKIEATTAEGSGKIELSEETLDAVNKIVSNLQETTQGLSELAKLTGDGASEDIKSYRKMSKELYKIAKNINSLTENQQERWDEANDNFIKVVKDLKTVTSNMKKLIAATQDNLEGQKEGFAGISSDLKKVIAQLRDTIKSMKDMTEQLAKVAPGGTTEVVVKPDKSKPAGSGVQIDILDKLAKVKPGLKYEVGYNQATNKFSAKGGVKITDEDKNVFILGMDNIGDKNQLNLQGGKNWGQLTSRIGLIESKLGLGLDYEINDTSTVTVDVIDIVDQTKLDVYGTYSLYGYDLVLGLKDFYLGTGKVGFNVGIRKEY